MSSIEQALGLALGIVFGVGAYLLITKSGTSGQKPVKPSSRKLSASSYVFAGGLGLGFAVIALLITGIIGIAVAAGFIGATLIAFLRSRRQAKIQRANEECFPDIIENLISRVRSGAGLMSALAQSASTAPPAVSAPASKFWRAVHVSGDTSACLDDLKAAWASPTGDLLIETVRVAHSAGGSSVVEVLRELADQVRRDRNLRREVEAKQSWVRVAARVGVTAPWVVLVLLSLRSEAANAYNSPAGITLIICGLALSVVSYRLMLFLGHVPPAQRVFKR